MAASSIVPGRNATPVGGWGRGDGTFNILFVVPNLGLAGAQKAVVELVKGLDRSRFTPLVCCLYNFGHYEQVLRALDVELLLLRPGRARDPRFALQLSRLMRQRRIDAVNVHQHVVDFWVAIAAKLAGIPCIVTKQNVYPHRGVDRVLIRFSERFLQRTSVAYVAVSGGVKEHLVSDYGVDQDRTEVIYNSLDTSPYGIDPAARARVRAELGVEPEHQLVGTVANLFPVKKGYEVLLESVPSVIRSIPTAVFICVGRDVEGSKEKLERRAQELGVAHAIRFLGARDDIPELLSALDLFVVPSLREGLPFSLLEATATGLPAVVTAVGGNPEVVVHEQTGLVVPPGNAEALAEAILAVLRQHDRGRELGIRGAAVVRNRFSAQAMVRRYEEILAPAVQRVRARSSPPA